VIVTAHEESGLIEQCIASVKAQTWTNWECVVMDDASTDDTVDVAVRAIKGDPRFTVFASESNSGLGLQRNAGVAVTRAPLVTFLDADDFYFPESLESRLRAARREPHPARAGVFCNWVEVSNDTEPTAKAPQKRRRPRVTWLKPGEVQGVPFIATAPLMDRQAFLAAGGFRATPISEDVDLWQRMLRSGFYFDCVKEVGVAYRQRPESMLRKGSIAAAVALSEMIASNAQPLEDADLVGPHLFRDPFYLYGPKLMLVRRLVRAAAFELAAGRRADGIVAAVGDSFEPWMEWMLPLREVVDSTSRLAALAIDADEGTANRIAGMLTGLLEPLARKGREEAGRWRQDVPPASDLDVGQAARRPATTRHG